MQAIGRQPQRAPDGAPVHYERHRPEQTTLYRLVQQHAATFIAETEAATGADLPQFVKDEFDAFLECGILAHGFLRLRGGDCGHDKLVAFSCKRRGFCPSCGARRMAQTAAHLVDHVIPHVPVRQWVLSLPIPLRLLLAAQPKLVTPVLQVVHRVITRHLLGQAGLKAGEADSGAVTLIQRFGSAANLNIHMHCLVLDGVYRCGTDGEPEFVEVPAPTDGPHAQTAAGGSLHLSHRLRPARRTEGADTAGRHAQGYGLQAEPVRRHAGFQPARRRVLRHRRAPGARTMAWPSPIANSATRPWPSAGRSRAMPMPQTRASSIRPAGQSACGPRSRMTMAPISVAQASPGTIQDRPRASQSATAIAWTASARQKSKGRIGGEVWNMVDANLAA